MIKVNLPNLNNIAQQYFGIINPRTKKGFADHSLIEKLKEKIKNDPSNCLTELYRFILDEKKDEKHSYARLQRILTGSPEILEKEIQAIQCKAKKLLKNSLPFSHDKNKKYREDILKVFGYEKFRKNTKSGQLAEELNIRVCPYCNREYAFHFRYNDIALDTNKPGKKQEKVKVLFDFDHFLDKATYPYLSLSFFNLIPSCTICNSRFKHSKEFTYHTHVHPFTEGYEKILKFTINFKIDFENSEDKKKNFGVAFFYGNRNSFEVKLRPCVSLTEKRKIARKLANARRNINALRLEEVYNQHKDYVYEIVKKSIIYNDDYIADLYQQYAGTLFRSEEEVRNLLLTNYISDEELDKRPLAKLTQDIAEELGLV